MIRDNEKALTLYKKQGFRINRILNCYQLTGKIKEPGVYKVWKLEHPEKLQDDQWTAVKDFWSYPPSWQNAKDAVCAIAKSFSYTIVKFDGNLIGYGIVDKMKVDIVQLAVHPKYRRMGVATEILLDLLKQTKSLEMRVINVDERDQALNAFLLSPFPIYGLSISNSAFFSEQDRTQLYICTRKGRCIRWPKQSSACLLRNCRQNTVEVRKSKHSRNHQLP